MSLDGKQIKTHRLVRDRFAFSPDGARLAYVALMGEKIEEWSDALVVDGAENAAYKTVDVFSLAWSKDGKRFAYTASREGGRAPKVFAVTDGQEGKSYDLIAPGTWSPNGARFAYAAKINAAKTGGSGLWFAVVDGKEEGPL